MKKIFAMILALAMILSLNLTAFAETISSTTENNSSGKDVTVTVNPLAAATPVYHVVVTWASENISFTYSKGTQGKWDPDNHEYGEVTGAGWTTDTIENAITVVNKSDAGVSVNVEVQDKVTDDGVTVSAATTDATALVSYATLEKDAPATAVYKLVVSGDPVEDKLDANKVVATITVTITASN